MALIPDASGLTPRPAPDVRVESHGRETILRRRRLGPVRSALGRLAGVDPDVTVRLEGMASEAWRLMDGARTLQQVSQALAATHPHEEDVPRRLGTLVGTLASKGFLLL